MGQTTQLHHFLHREGWHFSGGGQHDAHPARSLRRRELAEIDVHLLLRRRAAAQCFRMLRLTRLEIALEGESARARSGRKELSSCCFYHHLSCEGRQQSSKGLEEGGFPTSIAPDDGHQLSRL